MSMEEPKFIHSSYTDWCSGCQKFVRFASDWIDGEWVERHKHTEPTMKKQKDSKGKGSGKKRC